MLVGCFFSQTATEILTFRKSFSKNITQKAIGKYFAQRLMIFLQKNVKYVNFRDTLFLKSFTKS